MNQDQQRSKTEDENEDENDWGRKQAGEETDLKIVNLHTVFRYVLVFKWKPLFDYEKLDVYRVETRVHRLDRRLFWATPLNRRSNDDAIPAILGLSSLLSCPPLSPIVLAPQPVFFPMRAAIVNAFLTFEMRSLATADSAFPLS